MAQTTPITKEQVQAMAQDLTSEKAQKMLLTEPAKLRERGLAERCVERYREILLRRGNYGILTTEDVEFLLSIKDADSMKPEALAAVCKESGNTTGGIVFGVVIIGGTLIAIAVKNIFFPPKPRTA